MLPLDWLGPNHRVDNLAWTSVSSDLQLEATQWVHLEIRQIYKL